MKLESSAKDYKRIEKAILFLDKNFRRQPVLKEVARAVNLSEYHFQRLFRRWAGISPKKFMQFLTVEHVKKILNESQNLLDATYQAGLSAPSRIHDLFVTIEAMTPGEFKKRGEGLVIRYGFHHTPFGECMPAITERGICGLAFMTARGRRGAINDLKIKWKNATLVQDDASTAPFIRRIFSGSKNKEAFPVKLMLAGTNFQIKVWEALLKIPEGSMVSYEFVASAIDKPAATRAVASAVARNPIGYIIPCHRVIRKIGVIGDYGWGAARKKAMLGWEAA
ncbi:MAG: methylated-DNA--[protein]-cysteine S-methyltransferase [Nitrospirae bacterium]|nr:methylated-DNA--[protein]-cysteine S-methyltransferase [Nitrospirota bacterium]